VVSWIELSKLLKKIEDNVINPKKIVIRKQHLREDKREYDYSIRTHYRYGDFSVLTAQVDRERR
jgi:hypothetical protein